MNASRALRLLMAVIPLVSAGSQAAETSYPGKPVRVVVPFTPGTATEVFARIVCARLSDVWHQPVLVDNRPGAGGTIGTAIVAKAANDGYTLLWSSNAFATSAAVYTHLPYDPIRDFVAIAPLISTPLALVVSPGTGIRTVGDLISAAKAKPGTITYGSNGTGSGTHFAAEKFRIATGLDVTHIPYKGGPEVNGDVIAGRVTYWFAPMSMAAAGAREGRLNAVAVTTAQRSADLPDVPTLSESGLARFDYKIWIGLWAPAGTPTAIVQKISADASAAVESVALRDRLAKLGAAPMPRTAPADFARFVGEEIEDSARIALASAIRP